ncbi:MAG: prolyl oligopeptidase family serine peptidase [Parachlamydia sp.]|nr:prolyl oligopeptidase family serine peptidase [Parachlamydia sp.]
MLSIADHGISGKFICPIQKGTCPAILVLGGSEGGMNERAAHAFADNGYAALALAYFKGEGLPQVLEEIPLEYFFKAVQWLSEQPNIDRENIHLYGSSKGGELVLLLASSYPQLFASATAIVPSAAVYGGVPNSLKSSWTVGGEPLHFAPTPGKKEVIAQLAARKTIDLTEIFLQKMTDRQAFEEALIPVENITCPLLVVSGQDDRVWPSSLYAERVMDRLKAFHSPIYREHLSYEGVGHMITSPNIPVMTQPFKHPLTGLMYEVGGSPEKQEAACHSSWEAILEFLKQSGMEYSPRESELFAKFV